MVVAERLKRQLQLFVVLTLRKLVTSHYGQLTTVIATRFVAPELLCCVNSAVIVLFLGKVVRCPQII